MWSKFHQNRPRILEMRGQDTDTHTHKHTDTHTHTHILTHRRGSPWVNIFSPEMTKYKKVKKNKNAKALKLHSVILLFPRLCAIESLQRLAVILTVVFDRMHLICIYS